MHGFLLLLYGGFNFHCMIGGLGARAPKLAWGLCGLAGRLLPCGSVSLTHETTLVLIGIPRGDAERALRDLDLRRVARFARELTEVPEPSSRSDIFSKRGRGGARRGRQASLTCTATFT